MSSMCLLKIYRGMPGNRYWEEFNLTYFPGWNIISCLMAIQKDPINKEGKKVEPIVWEQGCLEEVCGSCSMLINGKPRQACTALIESLLQESRTGKITIAPLSKFPLVRDLIVDRSSMFESLKKIHGWIDADEFGSGSGPRMSQDVQEMRYSLSTCMTCGCCTEACPQFSSDSKFIGPAAISQVRLFNAHPTGKLQTKKRLKAMMEEGGVADCGDAQNCVRVCPKNIPLTDSIAAVSRDVTLEIFKNIF